MSVWRIADEAVETAIAKPARDARDESGGTKERIDRLTKWIPGDVLALYVAGVTALANDGDSPSVVWLVIAIVSTPLIVVGMAVSGDGDINWWTVILNATLALIAFVLWSVTVPFSGWQRWDLIADNTTQVGIGVGLAAVIFGLFAEGISRRIGG